MSELPPPERRPEPLGFDPSRNRIAEREAAARSAAALSRPATGTLNPTRNLQADLIGRSVGERYMVKGVLGEGGMGTVYEAEHMGLGRAVAIKVLNPSQAKKRVAVKRFQQEARAAGAIGHPNICEVYDLGQLEDGSPYLVMEKLVGTTLADRILREGGLPFDEIADVMIQVLSGLIAAHGKGIVHRDIKPENIFLARRVGSPPIVKILDFGVSKMMPAFQGGEEQLDLTRTGMVMGTPYYMSPEQARGERNLDGRVDVYACGVMMYEAIVGKRPFLAPNYNALLLAIINTVPRSIREVRPATPAAMESIVVRMMAKARDDRYPTANAVLRDIQSLPVAAALAAGRVPAPPTAAERMRAPVLGGGRASHPDVRADARADARAHLRDDAAARSTRGGRRPSPAPPGGHGGSAGATLRSRMADPPARREGATRLDIRMKEALGPPAHGSDSSGSIEVPIHLTGSDLNVVPAVPPRTPRPQPHTPALDGEDIPTQIFRPGMHVPPVPARPAAHASAAHAPSHVAPSHVPPPASPAPPVSARSPSATRVSPAGLPHRRPAPQHPPVHVQPPQPHAHHAHAVPGRPPAPPAPPAPLAPPAAPAPANVGGLVPDEWDGETVVKRPAALSLPRRREPKPFNPDDTVNLNGDLELEVDFSDDSHDITRQPPPRRR